MAKKQSKRDEFTFLVGGKAGAGTKKAGDVAAKLFSFMGRHVFVMDDYPSLIKGGHNFTVVSTAERPIDSHYMRPHVIVCCDKRSYDKHIDELAPNGIIVYNSDQHQEKKGIGIPMITKAKEAGMVRVQVGIAAVAVLAAAIGMKKEDMHKLVQAEYKRGLEINYKYCDDIYDTLYPEVGKKFPLKKGKKKLPVVTGNLALSLGAIASGLDIYAGYPMTPSSSILHYMAKLGPQFGVAAIHAENEIAVVNMAVGSAYAGARTMIGSSGGGVALMQEGFSLAGITETPLLCVLASRPGPATGVPTYTSQGDLRFALNQGHGEFSRIVASPGSMEEAFYLAGTMLDLVWKFQIPGMYVTEKHLSESKRTVDLDMKKTAWPKPLMYKGKPEKYLRYKDTKSGISPLLFPPSKAMIKSNSYETTEDGVTTEEPEEIVKQFDKRGRKHKELVKAVRKLKTTNITNPSAKGPVIVTYGSTTMSVKEALYVGGLKATVVQPVFLEPFPTWDFKKFAKRKIIVVEVSATGQFAQVLEEKTGIKPAKVIKCYDGRPFDPEDLAKKLKGVL